MDGRKKKEENKKREWKGKKKKKDTQNGISQLCVLAKKKQEYLYHYDLFSCSLHVTPVPPSVGFYQPLRCGAVYGCGTPSSLTPHPLRYLVKFVFAMYRGARGAGACGRCVERGDSGLM
jgi:hypothetical protein